ncbi:hypothetical protein AG4045_008777 [Apium graveolens]|uniref:JmjC domain-containing protein n=1 Tax=Apium graveolens TaxID=4045 RepID=A0A6L5BAV2_APIGR|nr:hypothetical protein AG4045_008777 [Apium graveolens]
MKIIFNQMTTVQVLNNPQTFIPLLKFELIDVEELYKVISSTPSDFVPTYASDVIDLLEDFKNVKLIQTQYGERKIVKFRIIDGRYIIYNVYMIIYHVTFINFTSSVQINTLSSSKIYLNIDNDIVHEMRIRLEEEGYKVTENSTVSPTQTPNTPIIIETVTLKELGKKNAREDINKSFLCSVKVYAVEEGDRCGYLSCIKCKDGEALRNDDNYKCSSCTSVMPHHSKLIYVHLNIIDLSSGGDTPGTSLSTSKKIKTYFGLVLNYISNPAFCFNDIGLVSNTSWEYYTSSLHIRFYYEVDYICQSDMVENKQRSAVEPNTSSSTPDCQTKRIRRANVKGKKGRGKKGGFQKQNRSGGDECGDSGAKDEGFVQENDNLGGGFDGEGQDKELKKKSSDFVVLEGQDFEKLGGSGYQGFRDEMEVSERNGKQKKVNYQETTELRRCQKKNVKIIKNVDNEELDEFSPEDDLFPKRRKKSLTNKDGGGNCRTQTRGQKRKETDTNKSLTDENGEPLQVMCHQCRRNDRDRVVICGNCKLKGYCVHCMTTWYPTMTEDDFARSCPVCQINCNCIRCLRMKVPQGDKKKLNLSMSFTNEEKIQSSKYIVSTLLPFLKQFNEEQMREKHIEAQVQGLSLSELEVEKAKRGLGERMHCDNCKASIADFHRSCTNCAYNLCLVCCQELRDGCLQGSQEEMNIKILDPGSAYMHGGNLKSSSGISNETTGEDRHPASTLYIQVKASNEDHSRSTSQWKPLKDGNIPCPPNTSGGCSKGILKLLCLRGKDFVLKLLAGAEELSYKYKLITETPGQRCSCFDSVGEIGTNKLKSLKAASREDFSDNYLYCPAAGELQAKDSSHFQYHWLKGEPVIVSNVLESTRGLSWEPMVMCRAVRQIKHFNRSQLLDVVAVDCLNWREVDVNSRQFFNGYLEGKFDNYGWPQILKLEDWPPSITFEELLPRHNAEFLSSLSFKEYTNPRGGYLNLVVKLPEKSNHPDTGPKMCIAYGNAQELGRGDSVTKLHSDMTDVVNVLTHIQEVTFTSAQQAKIDKLKQRHIAQDKREIFGSEQIVNNKVEKQQDVNEKKRTELDEHAGNIDVGTWDNNVEGIEHPGGGALWDIFRRQDSPKLEEYLKKNFREFRHINCRPLDQAVHPIHDRTFYLTLDHKRRLKEEYGIEPWTFVQKRGDAVYIPAGCPNQVRNIKSCIKVSMGFVSPENVSESIRLAEEIRVLPQNHSAKVDNLEIKKLILYAIAQAVRDLEKLPA